MHTMQCIVCYQCVGLVYSVLSMHCIARWIAIRRQPQESWVDTRVGESGVLYCNGVSTVLYCTVLWGEVTKHGVPVLPIDSFHVLPA
jgi:hypothetical protein